MEPKVTIVAKDGKADVQIGRRIVQLDSHTQTCFHANSIGGLVEYVDKLEADGLSVFCSTNRVLVWHLPLVPYVRDKAVAGYDINTSVWVSRAREKNGAGLDAGPLEAFLYSMRQYLDGNGKKLYDQVRNLTLSKVATVERKKERNGDFRFNFGMESNKHGNADVKFPETIKITVPLVNSEEDASLVEFEYDVSFEYSPNAENPRLGWTLDCPDFDRRTEQAVSLMVKDSLEGLSDKVAVRWGDLAVETTTNENEYFQTQPVAPGR